MHTSVPVIDIAPFDRERRARAADRARRGGARGRRGLHRHRLLHHRRARGARRAGRPHARHLARVLRPAGRREAAGGAAAARAEPRLPRGRRRESLLQPRRRLHHRSQGVLRHRADRRARTGPTTSGRRPTRRSRRISGPSGPPRLARGVDRVLPGDGGARRPDHAASSPWPSTCRRTSSATRPTATSAASAPITIPSRSIRRRRARSGRARIPTTGRSPSCYPRTCPGCRC